MKTEKLHKILVIVIIFGKDKKNVRQKINATLNDK